MYEIIDETNFLLYAARCYNNPQCHNTEEFLDDVKRFKYLKRLFGKFHENGTLKERLMINHIVILYNLFSDDATRMLFYKLEGFHQYLKPFLVLLGKLPPTYIAADGSTVYTSSIIMNDAIIDILRKI